MKSTKIRLLDRDNALPADRPIGAAGHSPLLGGTTSARPKIEAIKASISVLARCRPGHRTWPPPNCRICDGPPSKSARDRARLLKGPRERLVGMEHGIGHWSLLIEKYLSRHELCLTIKTKRNSVVAHRRLRHMFVLTFTE